MQVAAVVTALFSILVPAKTWFAPDQPLTLHVQPPAGAQIALVLTDFSGKSIEAGEQRFFDDARDVDLKQIFQPLSTPATYVLWAVPKGRSLPEFVGTPIVIEVKPDTRRDAPAGPMVVRIEPLCYATLSTERGDATIAFFYDAAPNTIANFIGLASGGFYDGLPFHRIVPGFVVQGGDPRGDGTGGPGYTIDAEFNDHEHRAGVVSMARQGDPLEAQGAAPRSDFANTAGSQFFICLDYERTRQLDRRYTAFGKVTDGMNVIESLAASAATGAAEGGPTTRPVMRSIRIHAVEPGKNPYQSMMQQNLSKGREGS